MTPSSPRSIRKGIESSLPQHCWPQTSWSEASEKGLRVENIIHVSAMNAFFWSIRKGIERILLIHLFLKCIAMKHPKRDWKRYTLSVPPLAFLTEASEKGLKVSFNLSLSSSTFISSKHPKRDWKSYCELVNQSYEIEEASEKGLKERSWNVIRRRCYLEASKKGSKDSPTITATNINMNRKHPKRDRKCICAISRYINFVNPWWNWKYYIRLTSFHNHV